MKNIVLLILKYFLLFSVYGVIYFIIESLYKGHFTNPIMFMTGGIIGLLIGLINNLFDMDKNMYLYNPKKNDYRKMK